jgi:hypothetical protein
MATCAQENDTLAEVFDRLVTGYERLLRQGCDQRLVFEQYQDRLIEAGFPPLQAANLVRFVIAEVGRRNGQQVYSEEDLRVIARLAAGEPEAV